MKRESSQSQLLVKNPFDQKIYDLSPLFKMLSEEKLTFEDLHIEIVKTSDLIPQILDISQTAHLRELQNSLFILSRLRDTFASIQTTETKIN